MSEHQHSFNSSTILIIEDSELMRSLIGKVLRAFDFGKIESVEDVASAFAVLERAKTDIVLTDWLLEGPSGLDFASKLRRNYEDPLRRTPIVMCTAYTDLARIFAARDAGVNEILTKPFSPQRMYDALFNALFRPRRFIESADFVGPDRRRKQVPIDFPDRRTSIDPSVAI